MRRPRRQDPQLAALLRETTRVPMTAEARFRQAVSFAYGNTKLEDERVTREQIAASTTAVLDQAMSPSKRVASRR